MAKIKVTNPKYVIDAHLKTNYFKLRNTGGPKGDKGDKGDTGATGPEGPQGATGATGRAATVAIGTTQTLNPGQSAFVNNVGTNNDAIFNFGIPQGEKGDKGDTGATGATGQAATVTVGTTTTLAAGSDATVTNSGTSSAAVLNFGIPKGDKGDTGEKGDTGGVRSEYVTELPASGQENTYYLTGDTATTGTASGESFQVTNNDNTGQVLLTQLNSNAEQTTYSGKNLISARPSSDSANGITWTLNSDGSVTVSGTATATQTISFGDVSMTQGQTYTLSGCPSGGGSGKYMFYTNVVSPQFQDYGSGATQTVTADATARIYFIVYSGRTISGTIYPMLEIGSSASPYEPYVGGTASPNPNYPQAIETMTGGQTVSVVGKNLLSIPTGTHSSSAVTWTITDSTISASGTATATWSELLARQNFAIPLSAGTYTFSIPQALPQRIQLVLYEANNTTHDFNIYEGSTYVTCTTTYTTVAYRIVYRANSSAVSLSFPNELMMEQSATPTTFSPYQGQSYTIDLGNEELAKIGTYRDRIYKDGGKWYIEKQVGKVVLDGTEAWTATGGGNGYRIAQSDIILTPVNTLAPIMSNYFTTATFSSIYNATVDYGIANHNSNYWIVLRDKNWTSASDVTTWLSTHPTTVYYALATPTTTEITNETLLPQLNFIANLYGGVNHISLVPSAGAQGTITVKYTTWDKNNRYDVYIWNDTIGDFQIIHSGGGNN